MCSGEETKAEPEVAEVPEAGNDAVPERGTLSTEPTPTPEGIKCQESYTNL